MYWAPFLFSLRIFALRIVRFFFAAWLPSLQHISFSALHLKIYSGILCPLCCMVCVRVRLCFFRACLFVLVAAVPGWSIVLGWRLLSARARGGGIRVRERERGRFTKKSEQVPQGRLKDSMQRTRSHPGLKAISALLIAKTHYKHQLINNKTDLCPSACLPLSLSTSSHLGTSNVCCLSEKEFVLVHLYAGRNCFVSMCILTLRIDSCSGIEKMY